jgi:hypothetical protein
MVSVPTELKARSQVINIINTTVDWKKYCLDVGYGTELSPGCVSPMLAVHVFDKISTPNK